MSARLRALTSALMILLLAGATPAWSQTASGKGDGLKHMAGEVVSVSADSKTLTVKHTGKKKSKQTTFTVSGDAAAHLGDFKPGDSVRVGYTGDAPNLVARTITTSRHATSK